MTELLRIYNGLIKQGTEYCVICMRSGQDRRMVEIKSLEQFVKSINLPFNYIDKFQKVCYICERAAVAAYRFRLAVNMSGSIHNLFVMMKNRRNMDEITSQILGHKPRAGVVRNVSEWEQRLSEVRARSNLLRTDILVVDSLAPQQVPSPEGAPGDSADMYVIPDAPPTLAPPLSRAPPAPHAPVLDTAHANDALLEPEIYMDPMILENEERDPIEIKREEPTIIGVNTATTHTPAQTRPKPTTVHQKLNIDNTDVMDSMFDTKSLLLHPIVENNGIVTVPSLTAQILNGQLVTVDKFSTMIQTPKLAIHNGINFNLLTDPVQVANVLKSMSGTDMGNIAVVSDEMPINVMEDNILQSLNVGNTAPTTTNFNNTIPNTMLELSSNNGQIIVNQPQSGNVLTPMGYNTQLYTKTTSQNDIQIIFDSDMTHSIIIEDEEDANESCNKRKNREESVDKRRKSDTDGQREGGEKSKQRETDWEDKIPMDVISFMDATDPNAASVLTPDEEMPLARISDVHSVSDVHSPGDNVHSAGGSVHSAGDSVQTRRDSANSLNGSRNNLCTSKETITVTASGNNQSSGSGKLSSNIQHAIRKVQQVSRNVQQASRNVQQASRNDQQASRNIRPATRNLKPVTRNVSRNVQPASRSVTVHESIHQNVYSSTKLVTTKNTKRKGRNVKEGDIIDLS